MPNPTDAQLLEEGIRQQASGALNEAEQSFRRIGTASPLYSQAVQYLGWISHMRGAFPDAEEFFRRAIACQPENARFHCNLGNTLSRVGRQAEASAAYDEAERLDPLLAEVPFNRGVLAERRADWSAAEQCYHRAMELAPDFAPAIRRLAAMIAIRDAVAAERFIVERAAVFGNDLVGARVSVLVAASEILVASGEIGTASAVLTRAAQLKASNAEVWTRLGKLLLDLGVRDKAWEAYKRALRLEPRSIAVVCGAANTLIDSGRPERALGLIDEAMRRAPSAALFDTRGNALRAAGRLVEACEAYQAALREDDSNPDTWSNLQLTALARDDLGPTELREMASSFGKRFPATKAPPVEIGPCVTTSGIRLGILSSDLRRHPVGYFFRAWFQQAADLGFELQIYDLDACSDELTAEFRGHAGGWHLAHRDGAEALRERIRKDGLTMLLDLSGHTRGNRLAVLGERLAPRQVSFLGYAGTTGANFDARIVDSFTDPEGAERWSTEPLVRMAGSYFCYSGADIVGLRPSARVRQPGAPLRFGYFGQRSKVTDQTLRQWLLALNAFPKSTILVRCPCFAESASVDAFRRQVQNCGGDPKRFDARPWLPVRDYPATFDEVDLVLNSYPFHLATNMCDALLAGVPVVSFLGPDHRSRMGLSIATAAGVPKYCGDDDASYLAAIEQALRDVGRDGHAHLADNVGRSALVDGADFSRRFAAALRECLN